MLCRPKDSAPLLGGSHGHWGLLLGRAPRTSQPFDGKALGWAYDIHPQTQGTRKARGGQGQRCQEHDSPRELSFLCLPQPGRI